MYIGILTEKTLLIFSFFAIFPHLKRQLSLIINELKIEKKHSFPHLSLESPRRPAEQFRKSAISRAESAERCAVKMLACVSEWNRHGVSVFTHACQFRFFRDFRLAENRVTKLCLELASRLDFVIRRCGRVFIGRWEALRATSIVEDFG